MKDKITITIEIEKLDTDTAKINDLIKGMVYDLNSLKNCKVINYSQIKGKLNIGEIK